MLEALVASPEYCTLVDYFSRPEICWAVLLPGIVSLAIVSFYVRRGLLSDRMQLVWVLVLPVSFYCARWEATSDVQQLFIYSGFSVACLVLAFHRVYVSPVLAYALTFLSLWWVDMTQALCHAIECDVPLDGFYVGVGGGGIYDSLFLMPLVTAAAASYALARLRSKGEVLAQL
jgi:hypothetical protein